MNELRVTIALILLLGAGFVARGVQVTALGVPTAPAAAARPAPLDRLPAQLGDWRGTDAAAIEGSTLAAVGADDVLNRTYSAPGRLPVGLYIAAYDRQRPTVSIHSPLHCLPGTGWSVLSDDTRPVSVAGQQAGSLRRLVAVRDRDRVVILYWYAIHGRMVASDALSRAYLLADSLRLGRNDAALVRLVIPVAGDDDAASERVGFAFIEALAPPLARQL